MNNHHHSSVGLRDISFSVVKLIIFCNATYATLQPRSFNVDIKQLQSIKATTITNVTKTNENSQKDTFNSSKI